MSNAKKTSTPTHIFCYAPVVFISLIENSPTTLVPRTTENLVLRVFLRFTQPLPPPGLFAQSRIAYDTTKLKLVFGAIVLVKGQRATHPVGVGSEGIATIVSNPQFPACEFFTPGTTYPVCLRHSTIKSVDDVLIDFCGGALRFAGSDEMDSPCDLIMGTGPTTPLWSSQAIFDAVRANIKKDLKTYLLLGPDQ